MTYALILTLAGLLLIPGVIMSVVPNTPGTIYMFVVALIFGFIDGFAHLSSFELVILALLTGVTLLVDFFSGIVGARWGGAHWWSVLWGFVGFFLGSAMIPIPIVGSLIGMFLGILSCEWYITKDARKANKAAAGSFLGWLVGAGFKLVASVVFLVLFFIFALV